MNPADRYQSVDELQRVLGLAVQTETSACEATPVAQSQQAQ